MHFIEVHPFLLSVRMTGIADDVNGVQFSSLVNKARKVNGVQFATLVNIADESDFPVGLVNIIKKGERGISVTYDLLGNTLLSFRSGGKYTYGISFQIRPTRSRYCLTVIFGERIQTRIFNRYISGIK